MSKETHDEVPPMPGTPRETPPLPAMLLDAPGEPQEDPKPVEGMFCFAALLVRIRDGGDVHIEIASGWNTGTADQAQGAFIQAVRLQYPGYAVTKVTSQELVSPR